MFFLAKLIPYCYSYDIPGSNKARVVIRKTVGNIFFQKLFLHNRELNLFRNIDSDDKLSPSRNSLSQDPELLLSSEHSALESIRYGGVRGSLHISEYNSNTDQHRNFKF